MTIATVTAAAATTVAVLGASGVFGRHLVPRLLARGHRVRALVRRPESAEPWRAQGVDVRRADIFEPATLAGALAGCDVAINLATALPAPGRHGGDFDANDRLRRDGVPLFLAACAQAGVPRVLQQSIAMVHCGRGEVWVGEDDFFAAEADDTAWRAIAAARAMEQAVQGSRLDWLILRGALFYGPGTGFDDDWFARAAAGTLKLPGDGSDFVSLVHIADMAAATVAAVERWPSRRALIVADDEPLRWRELFGHIAALAGAPAPPAGGARRLPSFRVSNRGAREALGWTPYFSSARIGLAR